MESNKWELWAEDTKGSIRRMFVGAVRDAIADGFFVTLTTTYHDSSNAALHWMIGAGRSSPSARKLGKVKDYRGGGDSLVGHRGDMRSYRSAEDTPSRAILRREVKTVVSKYLVGQRFPLQITFYNDAASIPNYEVNANLFLAGTRGLERVVQKFEQRISEGNVRKYSR